MAARRQHTARTAAAVVLNRFDPRRDYAAALLEKEFPRLGVTAERQRASDLVFGTVRNLRAIDRIISKLGGCPTKRTAGISLAILRVGVYELLYCPNSPEHAIVNEAVESAKVLAGTRQVGFVNAVLREVTRRIADRRAALASSPTKRTLPQDDSAGCEFTIEILPDPAEQPVEYLSKAFSLPEWLVREWLGQFGFERAKSVCLASNRRPALYVRANTLKTTADKLLEIFHAERISAEIVEEQMIRVQSPAAIWKLPGFAEGLFSVQDLTASQAVRLLKPKTQWRILDLCAAPGGKTTQLAELTAEAAEIVATDIDSKRLKMVEENITRLGISSVKVVPWAELDGEVKHNGLFDCVVLDVPCSNSGVLSRRPEVRHRINKGLIEKLAAIQYQLLHKAAQLLHAGGKICYSTCSIQRTENNDMIARFIAERPFAVEIEQLMLPSAETDRDGGYVALLSNGRKS